MNQYRLKINKLKSDKKQLIQLLQQAENVLSNRVQAGWSEAEQTLMFQKSIEQALLKNGIVQDKIMPLAKSYKDLLLNIGKIPLW